MDGRSSTNRHLGASSLPHSNAASTVGTYSTQSPANNTTHHLDNSKQPQLNHRAHPNTNNPQASYTSSNSSFNADALNAAFSLPAVMANHSESDYHNSIPFQVQQMNAAQLYATPPSTPSLSELYDTAGPTLLTLPGYSKHSMSSSRLQGKPSKKYQFPSSTSFSNIPHHHLTSSSSSYDSSDSHLYPRPPTHAPPPPPSSNIYLQTNSPHHNNFIEASPQYNQMQSHSTTTLCTSPVYRGSLTHQNNKQQYIQYEYQQRSPLQMHNYHNLPDAQHNNLRNLQEDESNYLQPKTHNLPLISNGSSPIHHTLNFTKPPASPRNKVPPQKPERPQKMNYKSHESIHS